MAADDEPRPQATTGRIRAAAGHHSRRVLSAYSGEHAVYGIVLVTALIALGWDDDTDLEVLVFVLGTVTVFWLAHVYAAVVASRGHHPTPPFSASLRHGMQHTSGMVIAMVIPALMLSLAVVGWVEEYTAYYLALGSGVALLALVGLGNSIRNESRWPWRVASVLTTTAMGLVVIALSIIVH